MRFFIFLLITVALVFLLNNSWVIQGNRIPPLGKFLDPFHGFWQNINPDENSATQEIKIKGLKDKVSIIYDSLLIPHIFAQNDEDLYLAQGYVTATHRLWQMDIQSRATTGRLAEILGPKLLPRDREQRRLGLGYAAEKTHEQMMAHPITKMMVEQYTAGINQYIQSLSYKGYPLEYKLMDFYPEEWSAMNCAVLMKSMAQSLNMGDKDIQMSNALKLFGAELIEILYPDRELHTDPIVSNPGHWAEPVPLDSIPFALPDELIRISGLSVPDPDIGSNNWAVSGSKTVSGSPILCNDPHLETKLPSLWFALQLHAPGINCMGVSLPGAPTVIIGFNDSIAWGITNAQRDLIDWYKISYKDSSQHQYQLDNQWRDIELRVEEVTVRGEASFFDTVKYTHWGPIPYDKNFRAEREDRDYAFRWISHEPSNEPLTFHELNRAKNYNDYAQALNHFNAPAQNIAFASVSGDIAIRIQGKFPVRRKLEGKFVLEGNDSKKGWQKFIPFEQNIQSKNPERGFVSSANQYPADSTYPYYINAVSYEAYRNRRINNSLQSNNTISLKDMMALQNDNYSIHAEESLPLLLSFLDSTSQSSDRIKALKQLRSWNYSYEKNSEAAPYFEAWWNNLMTIMWDEMNDSTLSLTQPTKYNTVMLMKKKPDFSFYDIKDTPKKETLRDIINLAFHFAVEEIEDWKALHNSPDCQWADYKDTTIEHLALIQPFSVHVKHGGAASAINASKRKHGPSWRMIVSLDKKGIEAYGVYPGGQSGNIGSKFYSNMIDHWGNGEYYKLSFVQEPQSLQPLLTTTLTPQR